jgi:hypothetical protein
MQTFYHKGHGRLYEGEDARQFARDHYARVTPGAAVVFARTAAGGDDVLAVVVAGREMGHCFGQGIASAPDARRRRGK